MEEYKNLLKTWHLTEHQVVDYIHMVTKGVGYKNVTTRFVRTNIMSSIVSIDSRETFFEIILDFISENRLVTRDLSNNIDLKKAYNLSCILRDEYRNNREMYTVVNKYGVITDMFMVKEYFNVGEADSITASIHEIAKFCIHIAKSIANVSNISSDYTFGGLTYDFIKVEKGQNYCEAIKQQSNGNSFGRNGYNAIDIIMENETYEKDPSINELIKVFRALTHNDRVMYFTLSELNNRAMKILADINNKKVKKKSPW